MNPSKRKLDEAQARDPKRVRAAALRLQARREHSVAELTGKLLERGYASEAVAEVVASLKGERLLSDVRFVDEFVAARVRRGSGPLKIREELRGRGVDPGFVDETFKRRRGWVAAAEAARIKRFGAGRPGDIRERARQVRFLQQRGFSLEDIRKALKGCLDD